MGRPTVTLHDQGYLVLLSIIVADAIEAARKVKGTWHPVMTPFITEAAHERIADDYIERVERIQEARSNA